MALCFLVIFIILSSMDAYKIAPSLDHQCPPWTSPQNGSCKCGNDLKGIVKCENGKGAFALKNCFCMTTQENSNSVLVGICPYTCRITIKMTHPINTNQTEDLNNETCGPHERRGKMCGKCIEGYGLPGYSYILSCVECTDYKYNWLRYIAVAYGPLTVFYFIIILLRISVTKGYMVAYVTVSQMLTMKVGTLAALNAQISHSQHNVIKYLIASVSIWNLDFFRSLYPPFCLHPHLSILQVLSLDYIVAVYPMILVLLTYLFVKLHDRFRLVVWLCRPAYTCFRHFKKEWDIKTSLIGVFATFYLLSYVKILSVSVSLITPSRFYNMNGNLVGWFFRYNATMQYFGREHWPFGVLAILVIIVFNVLPLILFCLYPCPCFQWCLNGSRYHFHSLHIFMDAILGCYSHRPRERRHFAAFYLILRIIYVYLIVSLHPYINLIGGCYILISAILAVAIFRPYKKNCHNFIDIALFSSILNGTLMILSSLGSNFVNPMDSFKYDIIYFGIAYLSLSISPAYGLLLLTWKFLPHKFIKTKLKLIYSKLHFWRREGELQESLPYRLEHDCEKDCLLTDKMLAS